jgi:hypothetical protein
LTPDQKTKEIEPPSQSASRSNSLPLDLETISSLGVEYVDGTAIVKRGPGVGRGKPDGSTSLSSYALWQKQQFLQQIAKVTSEKNTALKQVEHLEEQLLVKMAEIEKLNKTIVDCRSESEDHLGNIQLKSLMVKELAGMIQVRKFF